MLLYIFFFNSFFSLPYQFQNAWNFGVFVDTQRKSGEKIGEAWRSVWKKWCGSIYAIFFINIKAVCSLLFCFVINGCNKRVGRVIFIYIVRKYDTRPHIHTYVTPLHSGEIFASRMKNF